MVNISLKLCQSMNCCHKSNDSSLEEYDHVDESLEITPYFLLLPVAQTQVCSLACIACCQIN